MKKIKSILALVMASVIVIATLSGCSNGGKSDGAKFHLKEDVKKYGEVSDKAESAIIAFAEKWIDLPSKYDATDDLDEWRKLTDEFTTEFDELDKEYLGDIIEALKDKYLNAEGDDHAKIEVVYTGTWKLTGKLISVLASSANYTISRSEADAEEMANAALDLLKDYLDAYTAEGAPE